MFRPTRSREYAVRADIQGLSRRLVSKRRPKPSGRVDELEDLSGSFTKAARFHDSHECRHVAKQLAVASYADLPQGVITSA
jgi:hypothetical protein